MVASAATAAVEVEVEVDCGPMVIGFVSFIFIKSE